jgi:hypothetical protein
MKKKIGNNKYKKVYLIAFYADKEIHERYKTISKRIKKHGMSIGVVMPKFLVDSLEAEEAGGFEGLKKYI